MYGHLYLDSLSYRKILTKIVGLECNIKAVNCLLWWVEESSSVIDEQVNCFTTKAFCESHNAWEIVEIKQPAINARILGLTLNSIAYFNTYFMKKQKQTIKKPMTNIVKDIQDTSVNVPHCEDDSHPSPSQLFNNSEPNSGTGPSDHSKLAVEPDRAAADRPPTILSVKKRTQSIQPTI